MLLDTDSLPSSPSLVAHFTRPADLSTTTFPLDEGMASLSCPKEIGEESFHDFEGWVQIALRRIARSAGVEYPPKKTDRD